MGIRAILERRAHVRRVVRELFEIYRDDPSEVPAVFTSPYPAERRIADYIAGMTDRFAIREHERLTGRKLF